MALTTTQQQTITKAVVGVFNAAPGVAYMELLAPFADNQAGLIAALVETDAFKAIYPTILTNTQFATRLLDALVGNTVDATNKGNIVTYVATLLDGGASRGNVVNALINALDNVDPVANPTWANAGKAFDNKVAVAQYYTVDKLGSSTSVTALQSVIATVTPSTDVTSTDAMDAAIAGVNQSFMLTKDQDIIPGTAGNDTVNGLIDLAQNAGGTATVQGTSTTFNGFDTINGAAGTNTFKLAVSGDNRAADYDVSLANIEKIRVVEINNTSTGGNAITVDASTNADVTDLKVTKSTSEIELTGSDAQNISVAAAADKITVKGGKDVTVTDSTLGKDIVVSTGAAADNAVGAITVTDTKQGVGKIDIDGGSTVTVTATATATNGAITIGANKAATGAVSVTTNLNGDGTAAIDQADIAVTGGSTVTVNSNLTIVAKDASATAAHTFGDVAVTGDSKTTAVTVNQTYSETEFAKVDDVIVKEKDTVTFKAMTAGQTVTVSDGANTLTFTAAKALTAEQAAAAFTNLIKADTQSAGGPTANGYYSGDSFKAANALWTSATASGATVVFTAADENETDLIWGGTAAPTPSVTAGTKTAGTAATTNTVTYGAVAVKDDATAAITTITLNGFGSATLGSAGSLDKLTTLNLTNSIGDTGLTSTSTTLAVTLNNIDGGDLDLSTNGAVETLTLTTTGTASDIDLVAKDAKSLTIDAGVALTLQAGGNYDDLLETVVVKGAGAVDLDDLSAATKLKSFSAADNTGGVTATISAKTADLDATFTKYVFSKGADVVTMDEKPINKAIELGEGNDSIALKTGVVIGDITANIDGGAGDADTLILDAADAAALSAANTFNAKISGFERLSINAAAAQEVVDLDNIDAINYVTLAGSAGTAQTITLTDAAAKNAGANKYEAGDIITVTVNGASVTHTIVAGDIDADDTGLNVAIKVAINGDATLSAMVTAAVTDKDVITLTSAVAGVPITASMVITDKVGGTAGVDTITAATGTANAYGITLNNLANNGTVVLTDTGTALVSIKDAGTAGHDTDVLNLITKNGTKDVGYLQADDVETINISATETYTNSVANGDKQTLVLAADTATKVVVGGEGALDLTLFNTSDKVETVDAGTNKGGLTFTASLADLVVQGGTGADDLTANANDVKLYGNGGGDTLTVDGGLRVNLYGGDGADTFVISAGASSTLDAYTVINGVNSGDVIKMTGATKFSSTKIALSVGADETLLNYANQAVKTLAEGEMGWFQRGGNTFIVQDVTSSGTNSDAFTAGEDMIVMITGLVDLGTGASYNTSNILEIV